MILLACIAALAAFVQGQSSTDAALWTAACRCKDGSFSCTKAADVSDHSKTVFQWCNSDKPGGSSPSPSPGGGGTSPSTGGIPIDLYDIEYGCAGDKCDSYKSCCTGYQCVYPTYGRRLSNKKDYGVCIKVCAEKYDPCKTTEECCEGLVCSGKKCVKPCSDVGGPCGGKYTCCTGLVCDTRSGKCVIPCLSQNSACDIQHDKCCDGLVCTKTSSGKYKEYYCLRPCTPLEELCSSDAECCKGKCIGQDIGGEVLKLCLECVGLGGVCKDDCCDGYICKKTQTCITKVKPNCKRSKYDDCTEEVCSVVGECVIPCVGLEEKCQYDSDCCEGKCYEKKGYSYKKCKKY